MATVSQTGGRGLSRLLPIAGWLPRYDRSLLRGDVLAGIAVTAMIVPKDLGYAGIAGVPVQNGLYAAAAGAIVYALFCTSRQISTGPSSSLAAVAGGAVLAAEVGGAQAAELVEAITLVTGALFLLLALLRMGWIAQVPLACGRHRVPGRCGGGCRDRGAAQADRHVDLGRQRVGRALLVGPHARGRELDDARYRSGRARVDPRAFASWPHASRARSCSSLPASSPPTCSPSARAGSRSSGRCRAGYRRRRFPPSRCSSITIRRSSSPRSACS